MTTSKFLSILENHKDKSLIFEYQPEKWVPANYHITEVKNITIDAVDCGARADSWKETIIQLWESPSEIGKTEFMTAQKALGILNKVDGMRTMERNAEIKFEYGNDSFHTAQLFVSDFSYDDQKLILSLVVEKTDCKAKDECEVPVSANIKEEACCSPEGGCC